MLNPNLIISNGSIKKILVLPWNRMCITQQTSRQSIAGQNPVILPQKNPQLNHFWHTQKHIIPAPGHCTSTKNPQKIHHSEHFSLNIAQFHNTPARKSPKAASRRSNADDWGLHRRGTRCWKFRVMSKPIGADRHPAPQLHALCN